MTSGVVYIAVNRKVCRLCLKSGLCSAETFKVDINNTVELLKGDIGTQIRERNIIVRLH